jgi:hypothetical protein
VGILTLECLHRAYIRWQRGLSVNVTTLPSGRVLIYPIDELMSVVKVMGTEEGVGMYVDILVHNPMFYALTPNSLYWKALRTWGEHISAMRPSGRPKEVGLAYLNKNFGVLVSTIRSGRKHGSCESPGLTPFVGTVSG